MCNYIYLTVIERQRKQLVPKLFENYKCLTTVLPQGRTAVFHANYPDTKSVQLRYWRQDEKRSENEDGMVKKNRGYKWGKRWESGYNGLGEGDAGSPYITSNKYWGSQGDEERKVVLAIHSGNPFKSTPNVAYDDKVKSACRMMASKINEGFMAWLAALL